MLLHGAAEGVAAPQRADGGLELTPTFARLHPLGDGFQRFQQRHPGLQHQGQLSQHQHPLGGTQRAFLPVGLGRSGRRQLEDRQTLAAEPTHDRRLVMGGHDAFRDLAVTTDGLVLETVQADVAHSPVPAIR